MENVFIMLLFGHLIGDYFVQNNWMAQNKKAPTLKGAAACILHCSLYTSMVYMFLVTIHIYLNLIAISLIFLSHYILDRYNLLDYWCRFYGIRTWKSEITINNTIQFKRLANLQDTINISFGTFVSIVQDNALHLIMMWYIVKIFKG
jgi:hypothetical protein